MATIADVAREAGVARSTVSSVLTGRKFVEPHTMQRVQDAIERLNYTVNTGARALATARTMTLGLVVRFHNAEFSPALATYLVAVTDAAREHGYGVLLITDPDGPGAIRRAIASRQVDGFVLLSVLEEDPRVDTIARSGVPAVLIGMPSDTHGLDAVDLDFARAATDLVDHLVEHGSTSAALLTWPEAIFTAGQTYAARFRDAALARARQKALSLDVVHCPSGSEQVRQALLRLLRREDAPRALLVHNDAAVAMLPLVLGELGLRVPHDISVASLHAAELGQMYALPYTAADAQPEDVAAAALDVLMQRLEQPAAEPAYRLIATRVLERGSVR